MSLFYRPQRESRINEIIFEIAAQLGAKMKYMHYLS